MKKTMYVLLLSIFCLSAMNAQSLSQTVVGSSGATITGASNTLSFTVGEAIVGTVSNSVSLGQGFWLGAIVEVGLSNEDFTFEVQTTVYPNPITDYLNINFKEMVGQDFEIAVYDINGRQVFQKELTNCSENEILNFKSFSAGNYFLNIVQSATNKSKTFKIIKH